MSFHYLEGVEPESIVTKNSKSKYVSSLGDRKIYDMGNDHLGLKEKAAEKAQDDKDAYGKEKGFVGRSMVNQDEVRDAYHQSIRDAGFHGMYNSSLGPTMSHAIGMFDAVTPDSEHKLHPNDFKRTSVEDHHATDENKSQAKQFADENGHHSHKFLHGLSSSIKGDG